jgi:hypothetical protein
MSSKIIEAGPVLSQGARALVDPSRNVGTYPYQWIFPGPHSKQVLVNETVPLLGPGNTTAIFSYKVPLGMRLSVRGFVWGFLGTGWNEGSNQLVASLVVDAAGPRVVDFLNNMRTHMGSLESPYPILGRLEFEPLDLLTFQVVNTGGPPASSSNFVFAHLVGSNYPDGEGPGV